MLQANTTREINSEDYAHTMDDYQRAKRDAHQRLEQAHLAEQESKRLQSQHETCFFVTLAEGYDALVPHFLRAAYAAGKPGLDTFLVRPATQQRPIGVVRGWLIGELPNNSGNCTPETARNLVLLETGELISALPMAIGSGTSYCPAEPDWTCRTSGQWSPPAGVATGQVAALRSRVDFGSLMPKYLTNGASEASEILNALRNRLGEISVAHQLPTVAPKVALPSPDTSRVRYYRIGTRGRVSSSRKRLQGMLWVLAWVLACVLMALLAVGLQYRVPPTLSGLVYLAALALMVGGPLFFLFKGFPTHMKVKFTYTPRIAPSKRRSTNTSDTFPWFLAIWAISRDRRRR